MAGCKVPPWYSRALYLKHKKKQGSRCKRFRTSTIITGTNSPGKGWVRKTGCLFGSLASAKNKLFGFTQK